jgi:hypothetical protein
LRRNLEACNAGKECATNSGCNSYGAGSRTVI